MPNTFVQRAHRKVLDVINSVGLGETLLKMIERRQRMDVWMTYGGMVRAGREMRDLIIM